jgi:hypothetical protein
MKAVKRLVLLKIFVAKECGQMIIVGPYGVSCCSMVGPFSNLAASIGACRTTCPLHEMIPLGIADNVSV